jgi:hypothetical protein
VLHCTVPDTRVLEKTAFSPRVRALNDDGSAAVTEAEVPLRGETGN